MQTSLTAVIEQANSYTSDFTTEPYEAAWASEARWFVNLLEVGDRVSIRATPEISPDGLIWCEEGTTALLFTEPGLKSLGLTNFGGWLRLRVTFVGDEPGGKFLIYLALKG